MRKTRVLTEAEIKLAQREREKNTPYTKIAEMIGNISGNSLRHKMAAMKKPPLIAVGEAGKHTGQEIGFLKVGKVCDHTATGANIYSCVCECGNVCKRTDYELENRIRRSCGCQASNKPTLCWRCKHAVPRYDKETKQYTKGCEWSIDFKPVEGWTAKEEQMRITPKKQGKKNQKIRYVKSYLVTKCPKFERG